MRKLGGLPGEMMMDLDLEKVKGLRRGMGGYQRRNERQGLRGGQGKKPPSSLYEVPPPFSKCRLLRTIRFNLTPWALRTGWRAEAPALFSGSLCYKDAVWSQGRALHAF